MGACKGTGALGDEGTHRGLEGGGLGNAGWGTANETTNAAAGKGARNRALGISSLVSLLWQ